MMMHKLDREASKWSMYLLIAAVSSLVTTWAMETPLLHKKAETLEVVKEKVLPQVTRELSTTKTQLAQADCERRVYAKVAVQGVVAAQNPNAEAPEWSDFKGCETVPKPKVTIPKIPEVTQ